MEGIIVYCKNDDCNYNYYGVCKAKEITLDYINNSNRPVCINEIGL